MINLFFLFGVLLISLLAMRVADWKTSLRVESRRFGSNDHPSPRSPRPASEKKSLKRSTDTFTEISLDTLRSMLKSAA